MMKLLYALALILTAAFTLLLVEKCTKSFLGNASHKSIVSFTEPLFYGTNNPLKPKTVDGINMIKQAQTHVSAC